MMRWLRRESLRHLVKCFKEGDTVLEIGCGTGEEAIALARRGVRVIATDASPGMIKVVNDKLRGDVVLSERIRTQVLPAQQLATLLDVYGAASLDGAYSSLGALNCAPDLAGMAHTLATLVRPGGKLTISILNKYCLWETAWYVAALKPSLAFRRWSGHAQGTALPGGPSIDVFYWPVNQVEHTFKPHFRVDSRRALPWALLPTYASSFLKRRPRIFAALNRVERRTACTWPFYKLGDHVLIEMTRTKDFSA